MHNSSFLHNDEPLNIHRRHRRRSRRRAIFMILLITLGVWLIVFFVAFGQVVANALDGRAELMRAKEEALSLNFEQAHNDFEDARQSLVSARNGLVFVRSITLFPFFKQRIDDVSVLLDSGVEIVESMDPIIRLAQDLVQLSGLSDAYLNSIEHDFSSGLSFAELPTQTKQTMLRRISASAKDMEFVSVRIELAREELVLLRDRVGFDPLRNFTEPLADRLVYMEDQLSVLSVVARLLPEFAGIGQEKNHLVLFLNNDELRPGGGFIGTYGLLRLKDAEVLSFETKDVYALDQHSEQKTNLASPRPLSVYNETPVLFLRDANWSPDFAISSLSVIERFISESQNLDEQERVDIPSGSRVDGVIGFTPDFASRLLAITGPLTVSGVTFDSENVAEAIEYQVEQGFSEKNIPFSQRKEILSDLVLALQDELLHISMSRLAEVFVSARASILHKQLFLYSSHTPTEEVITKVGWGGRVLPKTTDVQMVVDSNLASLKTDPVVKRTIRYEQTVNESGKRIGRTTIRYMHTGSFDWRTTRYRTYTRLYVPKGSRLIRVQGSLLNDITKNASKAVGPVDVGEELGLTVFGAFTSIEPGQTGELVFDYELASYVTSSIEDGSYALSFLKQSGARDYPLTLSLEFGKNIRQAIPAEATNQWGDSRYELNTILDQDLEFRVQL